MTETGILAAIFPPPDHPLYKPGGYWRASALESGNGLSDEEFAKIVKKFTGVVE